VGFDISLDHASRRRQPDASRPCLHPERSN